jgi:Protein of unknown function (DUF4256)
MAKRTTPKPAADAGDDPLASLGARFAAHPARHARISWDEVVERLRADPGKRKSLHAMEASGGEPDVIGRDERSGGYLIADCAAETPLGRRSLCYDGAALTARKEHKPAGSAVDTAAAMGIGLLDEALYRRLQELGEFDRKTSSWILTPPDIRERGGALFADRRYGRVFVYHNGAESYFGARGFRGVLLV